jgi:hypothetical protein
LRRTIYCSDIIGRRELRDGRSRSLLVGAAAGAVAGLALARRRIGKDPASALVDQLSFPLVVPTDDPAARVGVGGEGHPAVPQMAGGWLVVPLENAGLGPAINVRATIATGSHATADQLEAGVGVISPGGRAALRFAVKGSLGDFDLRLTYQDSRARSHRLHARWNLEDRSYALDW